MGMNEQRAFHHDGEWWVAQIISATGRGTSRSNIRTTRETVAFTSLSDPEALTLSISIAPGLLNQMSHSSIVKHLEAAEPYGSRLELRAANLPSPDEYQEDMSFTDDEGLRWAYLDTQMVRVGKDGTPISQPAIELVCLDDSAMRRAIALGGELASSVELRQSCPFDPFPELAKAVKGSFTRTDPSA